MRIDLDGSELSAALAAGTHERRATTLPILTHVLIEAEGDSVRLTTTDMEAQCIATLPAKVTEPGRICAKAELLKAAARSGALRLTCAGDSADVLHAAPAGGSKLRIATMPANDFPLQDERLQWEEIAVPGTQLAAALQAVHYACTGVDVRRYLNGVWLHPEYAGASDGHRAAIAPIDYAGKPILIPDSQVQAVIDALGDDGTAALGCSDGMARVLRATSGGRVYTVRLIDTERPFDFRKVVFNAAPDDAPNAVFDTTKLRAAAKQFMPFCLRALLVDRGARREINTVILHASEGAAQLLDSRRENSENCSWALKTLDGAINIAVDARYLTAALGAISTDTVRVSVHKAGAANAQGLLLESMPDSGEPQQHLILPVTL